ncbi:unnamed protein product, partial [Symbiodinium sp. KB8]
LGVTVPAVAMESLRYNAAPGAPVCFIFLWATGCLVDAFGQGLGLGQDSEKMRGLLRLWEDESRAMVEEIVVPDFLSCSFDDKWAAIRLEMVAALQHMPEGLPRFPESLADLPKYPWLENLFSVAKEIEDLTVYHRHDNGNWHLAGDFHGIKKRALQPKHLQPETWSCFFGYISIFYIVAWWYALNMDGNEATLYLQLISQLLKKGQVDWTEHSGWPITSWSVYLNIQRLNAGMPFAPLPAEPAPVHPLAHLVPPVWPRSRASRQPAPEEPRRLQLSAFFLAMHVPPFSDLLSFLEDWWPAPAVRIYSHYMGFPECCPGVGRACKEEALEAAKPRQKDWRMPFCSQDEQLFSLIGMQEIHDHSQGQWEGAYRNHRHEHWADVKREFAAKYYNWLDSHVDLFLCGHPLFWCTLFEDLLRANQKKSMLAVYDQPPFFLVPEEGEDDFLANLRAFAEPEFRNAVLVGFSPFFSRQFEWLVGRKIPHSRPIALAVRDVWQPLQPDSVLFSTSIDYEAIAVFFRYAEENVILDPSGLHLKFLEWGLDAYAKKQGRIGLDYETPKSQIAQLRCVVVTPYDFAHLKLAEFKAMGMPMFMPKQLWKWTTRWSQMIARPAGRNASKFTEARSRPPGECYDTELQADLPMPTLPESFYRDPWGFLPDGGLCARALSQWDDHSGPFGRSPFQLFTIDRRDLQPLDGTLFWSVERDVLAALHDLLRFSSAPHRVAAAFAARGVDGRLAGDAAVAPPRSISGSYAGCVTKGEPDGDCRGEAADYATNASLGAGFDGLAIDCHGCLATFLDENPMLRQLQRDNSHAGGFYLFVGNENWHLYSQYASYCNGLEKQNEMYLFHGSPDTTNQIMDDGKGATAQDWRAALIRKELVVYKQNHAHPAYKITLLYTEPIRNPYDHPALFNQLLELEEFDIEMHIKYGQETKAIGIIFKAKIKFGTKDNFANAIIVYGYQNENK